MSSTLSEGVRVPDIGSVNWGADVNFNWGLLNTALANISGNVKTDVANTWTATQTFSETISGSIDGVAARAVNDEDGNNIKTALAGKQPSLSQSQLDAVNSGVTAAAVRQIGTNADNISSLQTAVSGKAADNAVVHLAGAETISGDKTFTGAVVTHNITPETDGTYTLGTSTYRWLSVYSTANYFINRPILTFGTPPSNSDYFGYRYNDNTGAVFGDLLLCAHKDGQNYLRMRCRNTDGTNTYDREMRLHVNRNGTTWVIPNTSSVIDLGTSTNKWKTLNGINPGALSIPDLSSYVDISGNMVPDSYGNIKFTPQIYGWVYIDFNVASATITSGTDMYVQAKDNNIANANFAINFTRPANSYHIFVWMPVWANKQIILQINFSGFSVGKAYIYPCLGNV